MKPDLMTPYLLVDPDRLERNARRMSERAQALGVRLRPHVKTIKSADLLRFALPQVAAITVSTLAEASVFAAAGYRDILYAVGITPDKLRRVAELRRDGVDLHVLLDSVEIAHELGRASRELGSFSAYIEIDTGGGRGGVDPEAADLLQIADRLRDGGTQLRGVLTHAGHAYHCRGEAELRAVAEQERAGAVHAAGRLRQRGHACAEVSVGSTPTCGVADRLGGVSEMRPGVFFFMDLFQHRLGICASEDISLSVVASVIGIKPHRGLFLIDAGALALSQDRSTAAQETDTGYGVVTHPDGSLLGQVQQVHQEHGFVRYAASSLAVEELKLGDRVQVWPNHACMTAAGHDAYVVKGRPDLNWRRVRAW